MVTTVTGYLAGEGDKGIIDVVKLVSLAQKYKLQLLKGSLFKSTF